MSNYESFARSSTLDEPCDKESTSDSGYLRVPTVGPKTMQTELNLTAEKGCQTYSSANRREWQTYYDVLMTIVACVAVLFALVWFQKMSDKSTCDKGIHYSNISRLNETNRNLTNMLPESKSQYELIMNKLGFINVSKEESERRIEEFVDKMNKLEKENRELKKKSIQFKLMEKDFEKQTTHFRKTINEKETMEDTFKQRISELENKTQKEDSLNQLLNQKVRECETSLQTLEQKCNVSETSEQLTEKQCNYTKQDIDDRDRDLNETFEKLKTAESRKAELLNETNYFKLMNSELNQNISTLKSANQQCDEKLISAETEKQKAMNRNQDLESLKNGLQEQVQDLQQRNKDYHSSLERLSQTLNETKQYLKTAETEKEEEHAKCSNLLKNHTDLMEKYNILREVNKKCEISWSECMSASAYRDNDILSKMEEYSHEKIAVEFRELYEQEYTHADDELWATQHVVKENTTEKYFFDIVKTAYELCYTHSAEHKKAINESITSINVSLPTNHEKWKHTQAAFQVKIGHMLSPLEMDAITEITLSTVMKLQEPIVEVFSDIITEQFEIAQEKQPKLMTFVRKCLRLCWMMNMNPRPIFLKFEEVTDSMIFDVDTYKPFLNSGKYIDYIVWPPMYSHEGGKLISKGLAQGKA